MKILTWKSRLVIMEISTVNKKISTCHNENLAMWSWKFRLVNMKKSWKNRPFIIKSWPAIMKINLDFWSIVSNFSFTSCRSKNILLAKLYINAVWCRKTRQGICNYYFWVHIGYQLWKFLGYVNHSHSERFGKLNGGLVIFNFIKKGICQHRCFPVNFVNYLITPP